MDEFIPKWHREFLIFSRVKPMLIVEGNVLDSYQYPGSGYIMRLPEYLNDLLSAQGYETVVFFDGMQGFYHPIDAGHVERFSRLTGSTVQDGRIASDFRGRTGSAPALIRAAMSQTREATAVVMNLASRYIVSPDRLAQAEVDGFTNLMLSSLEAAEVRREGESIRNLTVVIVGKANDIPAWFYMDNPNVKIIHVGTPSREERERLVKGSNFPTFFARDVYQQEKPYYDEHPEELARIQDRFVGLTDGFTFTELNGLRRMCKNERIPVSRFATVVDLYKYGITENPWDALDEEMLRDAANIFRRRVKGQDAAIGKTIDVIKRAVTGMSGLQGSSHNRPKGVLFFAGPTGTGKTETAKALAEMLFGDESCCRRFDMSEYGQSHSDQKLLGAPPGYIGYEAGGQLTNAVKENPFCILLFDEIEKAHPTILDKFLQILEDGRMTDSHGDTVYFSECIIIFTSNLGVYREDAQGIRRPNVTQEMPYETVRTKIRSAVEDYFKLELGRPELLNRIGENVVVFDFIRPEAAATILHAQLDKIRRKLQEEKRIALAISDEAVQTLADHALGNLANGGRGIGNIVESLLIDPLARCLFDERVGPGSHVRVDAVNADCSPVTLSCTITRE